MLKLNKYFFPTLNVQANPMFAKVATEERQNAEVDVTGSFGPHSDDPFSLLAVLKVTVKPPEEDVDIPYEIEVEAVGFFEISKDAPEEQVKTNLPLQALGMLHSAAREMIIMVTGRGPWDSFVLPIHTFSPDGLGSIENKSTATKPKKNSKRKPKK